VEEYRFSAYGSLFTGITAPYNLTTFCGQDYDPRTGLVDMHHRWYDPRGMRFLTPDPLAPEAGRPATWNPYLYAAADPVNRWDPWGLSDGPIGVLVTYRYGPKGKYREELMDVHNHTHYWETHSGWYRRHVTEEFWREYWAQGVWRLEDDGTEVFDHIDWWEEIRVDVSTKTHFHPWTPRERRARSDQLLEDYGSPPPSSYSSSDIYRFSGSSWQDVITGLGSDPQAMSRLETGILQIRLNEALGKTNGADALVIDGWYGPKTTAAVRELQAGAGLPSTGLLDSATLRALETGRRPAGAVSSSQPADDRQEFLWLHRRARESTRFWQWPVNDPSTWFITSDFGWRSSGWHPAIDLARVGGENTVGQPVLAAATGTLHGVGWQEEGAGLYVVLEHTQGGQVFYTRYFHLQKQETLDYLQQQGVASFRWDNNKLVTTIKDGEIVKGEQIGFVGYTGRCSPPGVQGSHLHFEVRLNAPRGEAVDPELILPSR